MREILFSLTAAATLFAPSVLAALKAIKVPVVRWPGGCFADEYHWRNGIGPAGKLALSLAPESVTVVSIE